VLKRRAPVARPAISLTHPPSAARRRRRSGREAGMKEGRGSRPGPPGTEQT